MTKTSPKAAKAVVAPVAQPTETLQRIPLSQLFIAPENARYGVDDDTLNLDPLVAQIIEIGRLVQPLHVYPDDEKGFGAWDGGRRLRALGRIQRSKTLKLPSDLLAGIPCLVAATRAEAMLLSAATFNREAMHPADEFLHYKRLLDAGNEPARIAAACAVPTPRVNQLLRLVGVAPSILDAFRAGELPLDVVEAFTLSLDHARQLSVLQAVGWPQKVPSAHVVRQCFRKDAVDPQYNRDARFVGREAYERAGGTFLVDLFSDDEDWADGGLVKELAEAKRQDLVQAVAAEGWASVQYVSYEKYNFGDGYHQVKKAVEDYTADFKATAVAFVKQDYQGELEVRRGYVRENKAVNATGAAVAKPDQALYGFGHGGHYDMTLIAGEAVRVALANDPAAAYDAMLTHLSWVALKRKIGFDFYSGAAGVMTASKLVGEERRLELAVEGTADFKQRMRAWAERLPDDRVAFCDAVAALSPEDKADLLALSFAETVEACEGRFDNHKPKRWAHLGWMARRAGVNLVKAWTPDADWLKKGSKDALAIAAAELYDGPGKREFGAMKKGDLVKQVAADAKKKGWVPKLLRDLAPPVRENPDEATLETLSAEELLVLAEVAHKHRTAPLQYQLSPESRIETVVPIQTLDEAARLATRPLMWGGFFGLVAVQGQDCLRANEPTFRAADRPDAPPVTTPYKTWFLNTPAA